MNQNDAVKWIDAVDVSFPGYADWINTRGAVRIKAHAAEVCRVLSSVTLSVAIEAVRRLSDQERPPKWERMHHSVRKISSEVAAEIGGNTSNCPDCEGSGYVAVFVFGHLLDKCRRMYRLGVALAKDCAVPCRCELGTKIGDGLAAKYKCDQSRYDPAKHQRYDPIEADRRRREVLGDERRHMQAETGAKA